MDDNNRAEVAEKPKDGEKEGGINKIAPMNVDELTAGELQQRRGQLSPRVEIGDRIERKRESSPRGDGKHTGYDHPVNQSGNVETARGHGMSTLAGRRDFA